MEVEEQQTTVANQGNEVEEVKGQLFSVGPRYKDLTYIGEGKQTTLWICGKLFCDKTNSLMFAIFMIGLVKICKISQKQGYFKKKRA